MEAHGSIQEESQASTNLNNFCEPQQNSRNQGIGELILEKNS